MARKNVSRQGIRDRIKARNRIVVAFRDQLDPSRLRRKPRDPVEWVFLQRKAQLLPSEQMRVLPIGEVLKANRLLAGFSQAELARRVGVSQQAIQRLEGEKSGSPTIVTIGKVANALGCDVQVNLVPQIKK